MAAERPARIPINPSFQARRMPDEYLTCRCIGEGEDSMCRVVWYKRGTEGGALVMPYRHWCAFVEFWELSMWKYGPDGLPEGDVEDGGK